jgi:hypothetical protein
MREESLAPEKCFLLYGGDSVEEYHERCLGVVMLRKAEKSGKVRGAPGQRDWLNVGHEKW